MGKAVSFGVFVHRADSIYEDSPATQYQFPKAYLSRAQTMVGDWVIYYEPTKVVGSQGYFAVAKIAGIRPDPNMRDMYIALIEPGSYLDFADPVPFRNSDGLLERGLLNELGAISGRAQAAVRPISGADFYRIVSRGLANTDPILPRVDGPAPEVVRYEFDEGQAPFEFEQDRTRITALTSRIVRDRVFRKRVLQAYGERCAVTGLKLINGGGRAEVAAAHIRPVESSGPDIINNGVALSGTAHWMFDRGLISVSDELEILVSRHVNDREGVTGLISRTGRLVGPQLMRDRPHPAFLAWHRENCFKQ